MFDFFSHLALFFPLFCFCPLLSLWLQRHQRQGAADVKLAKLDCGGWYYLATVEKIAVVGLSCPVLRGLVLHCSFQSCLKLGLAQLCSFLFAPAFFPSRHVLILLLCSPQFCCVPLSPAVISSRQLSSLYIFHIYILSPVILLLLISSCQCCSPPLLVIWLQRTETYTQTSMLSPYKKKKRKTQIWVLWPITYLGLNTTPGYKKRRSPIAKQDEWNLRTKQK